MSGVYIFASTLTHTTLHSTISPQLCPAAGRDQIVFGTDQYQYLKVLNDADEWVDSFSSDTEENDVMTCFRMKDKSSLFATSGFNTTAVEDFPGPGFIGLHFMTVGSKLWEEGDIE
eukprot:scaffold9816_cov99-Skeletonema_dohrnii-CCMP3373.AAC.7